MDPKDIPVWVASIAAVISAIAACITAVGLVIAVKQVRTTKEIAISQFEDNLNREYRELAGRLPTAAILGEVLPDVEFSASLDEFIHYIDLCNEQVFLRRCGRVSAQTWTYWRDGIQSNLTLPAFAKAWDDVRRRSTSFSELRRLTSDYNSDPAEWAE